MFIGQLFEAESKQVKVIYPGRFQPFHKGHAQVYQHLCQKFGKDNVYIVTSDKVEMPKSPFSFAEKKSMIGLTGIDTSRVVQDPQPYRAQTLVTQFDTASTILLFAISEKDMAEDPRFQFKSKKDGSPSYFQAFTDLSKCQTLDKHGYMMTVPTFNFTVLGQPANSASQIREQFAGADLATQRKIVTDLFGKFDNNVFNIMKARLEVGEVTEDDDSDIVANLVATTGRTHEEAQRILRAARRRATQAGQKNKASGGALTVPAWGNTIAQQIAAAPRGKEVFMKGESVGESINTNKKYGVKYKVFAGREQRLTTKKAWFSSIQAFNRGLEKIEALNGFYEFDGFSYPHGEEQGVVEDRVTTNKPPKKGSQRWLTAQKRKEYDKKNPPVEPADQMYGTAKILPKKTEEGRLPQLPTTGADYSKFDTEHLKSMLRPGVMHRNELKFKTLIRRELRKRQQGNKEQKVTELDIGTRRSHVEKRGPQIIPTLMKDVKKGAKMGRAVSVNMKKIQAFDKKSDEPNVFTEETNSAEMARLQRELRKATDPNKKEAIRLSIRKLKGEMELRARDKTNEGWGKKTAAGLAAAAAIGSAGYGLNKLDQSMQADEAAFVQQIKDPVDLEHYQDSRKNWTNTMALRSLGPVYASMADMENIRHARLVDKLKEKYNINETVVPGFGEMRPEQVKKEVEGLTAEMLQYARDGNMRAVAEYIKKLQPFVDTARKGEITESIDKALRTAKRNAV